MLKAGLKQLIEIYMAFFKLGAVSFGGGYAIIPLIEQEVVENKKWLEREKIIDIFSVAQALPGAIAINASTFVGYSVAGIPGAIAALLGNVTPSVVTVMTLSVLFTRISGYPAVKSIFKAIYPVVVGLILYAAYKIGKTAINNLASVVIAAAAFAASLFLHLDPIPLIIAGIVCGLVVHWIKTLNCIKEKKKGREL
ncbi:Chromate transport protein ChrA [Ruminiclostridium cellobioparum subsp. termitidis CT1112]|uniref:Chromate transport protein ChrA n=1 Tax=Ruminiclostridium cellobioparum subsp. termitidis CT1112 TaxID=1195236 RepID=S0FKH1_RUMCE|nr:Chromate transport protein ChrA [Ruminiclostridium cellobioparum subsp. termitidis CT1112]